LDADALVLGRSVGKGKAQAFFVRAQLEVFILKIFHMRLAFLIASKRKFALLFLELELNTSFVSKTA
jgi:hypothetical protein